MTSELRQNKSAWEGVPLSVLGALEREAFGRELVGYDVPLANGCWKCIGCGKFVSPRRKWNQCVDCDTRYPEEIA